MDRHAAIHTSSLIIDLTYVLHPVSAASRPSLRRHIAAGAFLIISLMPRAPLTGSHYMCQVTPMHVLCTRRHGRLAGAGGTAPNVGHAPKFSRFDGGIPTLIRVPPLPVNTKGAHEDK